MHGYSDQQLEALGDAILAYSADRLKLDPVPLDGPRTLAELDAAAGCTITADGIGGLAALKLFEEDLAPACISTDHPRYLSFIPCAPTEAAAMFDLVVGASSIYGGSWLEGAGAVYAENQALRWIADLVGLPAEAGGVFVPAAPSATCRRSSPRAIPPAWRPPSRAAAVPGPARGASPPPTARTPRSSRPATSWTRSSSASRSTTWAASPGRPCARCCSSNGPETFFAVVATSGTTNFGIVDDLESVSEVCREFGIWFHVDGAYGGAGLAAPSVRHLYAGIEHADSFIVDPHKWLFAPFDCCALLYREPALARAAHTQHASYLDVLTEAADWNPTDYSVGLTRRARGLPFWFCLATHGTNAYTEAVERTLAVTRFAAEEIGRRDYLEVVREPDLSVVVFRRIGWTAADYQQWSDQLLADQFAFVVPTSHDGETLTRFAIVNPKTSEDDITAILDTMA